MIYLDRLYRTFLNKKAHFNFKFLEVDPCVEKGCSDGCTNAEGTAVCDCRTNSLLILDADQKTCGKVFHDDSN